MTDEAAVAQLAQEFGRAELVVHSAGATASAPVVKESLAAWEAVLTANATRRSWLRAPSCRR